MAQVAAVAKLTAAEGKGEELKAVITDLVEAVLVANSAPFQDTGLTQAEALAAATTKFRVVHLAHLGDELYKIADVRNELQALKDAGFSVVTIEREGSHYDDPGAGGLPGTDADIRSYLIKQIDP